MKEKKWKIDMKSIDEYYSDLLEKLRLALVNINKIQEDLDAARNSFEKELTSAKENMEKQLDENEQYRLKLKAFIDIGKKHSHKCITVLTPKPFDSKELSRLAVQIDTGCENDTNATILLSEAMGQLEYVEQKICQIQRDFKIRKKELEIIKEKRETQLRLNEKQIIQESAKCFAGRDFAEFVSMLSYNREIFEKHINSGGRVILSDVLSIGTYQAPLPILDSFLPKCKELMNENFIGDNKVVNLPASIEIKNGNSITVEYTNETEIEMLSGIQNLILNIIKHYKENFSGICLVDPIRFNNNALGCLNILTSGERPYIENTPLSIKDVKKKINSILVQLKNGAKGSVLKNYQPIYRQVIIFHDFPQSYDSQTIKEIQQLSINAKHFGMVIILTHNVSSNNRIIIDTLNYIRTYSFNIYNHEGHFYLKKEDKKMEFDWYKAPVQVPEDIVEKYVTSQPQVDKSNDYLKRIGLKKELEYIKGKRQITDIPISVNEEGEILTLDFENSNYATFICGASRSGKSTLLHTIISGIIKAYHPDDVEIWLIDFKMTEFSRYIDHLPPHIRYIILDESPELVYDIIDRLTEVLSKRQALFMGKWQKLDEVPKEKYMPAIFVIIDEFSIMSQIVADSLEFGRENYNEKMQALLAKGAALGLHFVFSSQGFTSGTRGLSDFSKKQIQQRVAMKTEYNEIRETLDIKSENDEDKAVMESLPVYHVLSKTPLNNKGRRLQLSKVLYISDYSKQEQFIDFVCSQEKIVTKYNPENPNVYIDKKSMVIDGNKYTAFDRKIADISRYINSDPDVVNGHDVVLFIGEPRRMMPMYPIKIADSFSENLLLIAPNSEKMAAVSVILSISETLKMQDLNIDIWATKRNAIYKQLAGKCNYKFRTVFEEIEDICAEISRLKDMIQNKRKGSRYILLLGIEELFLDMSYQQTNLNVARFSHNVIGTTIEKREEGELDLISRMKAISMPDNKDDHAVSHRKNSEHKRFLDDVEKDSPIYDARDDLKFILTHGPRLGYHFILLFNTVGDLNQSKIDIALLKHKILFPVAKADAIGVLGIAGARGISELNNHSFRYSDGIEALSFRPYLHYGLSWDGWEIGSNGAVNSAEEEYLL